MHCIEENLSKAKIVLPVPEKPVASYLNYKISGNLVYISGQTPLEDHVIKACGKLGENVTVDEGYQAARSCGIQLIALLKEACDNNWENFQQIIKITAMVNATAAFSEHPSVVNGCSNLMQEIFGEAGRHARFSIGVQSLPENACVEIEMIAELK
jgi:enamine deaminase RidA (YjgF/YER057c/UK114 family)